MKLTLCCVLSVVLAALVAQAHVVFEVPLPAGPSMTEFFTTGAGNMYYTVGQYGQLFGVNLTSKKVQFTKDFRSSTAGVAQIQGLVGLPHGGIIIQVVDGYLLAFDSVGNFLWTSNAFAFSVRKNSYTIIGDTAYVASDSLAQFFVVDLKTGLTIGDPVAITAGNVYADKAVLTVAGANGVPTLTAYSLPSMTVLWAIPNVLHYLTDNDKYFLVTNVSIGPTGQPAGETNVLVLDRTTQQLISTLHAMEGVYTSGFTPVINGSKALFVVGDDVVRLIKVDLATGDILYEIYLGDEAGAGTFLDGNTKFASISKTTLTVLDLNTGKMITTVSNVPYTQLHTIADIGNDEIAVVNLQGYTAFNYKTGKYISRNEMLPGYNPTAAYKWNGMLVSTQGAAVVVSTSS